mmetsp:Transcript_32061/g.60269  ORF Transcript_32061/g.60269 Transcript_32061/m.60269 type:complete len:318 (-) Transcript_32061:216-1169(-)
MSTRNTVPVVHDAILHCADVTTLTIPLTQNSVEPIAEVTVMAQIARDAKLPFCTLRSRPLAQHFQELQHLIGIAQSVGSGRTARLLGHQNTIPVPGLAQHLEGVFICDVVADVQRDCLVRGLDAQFLEKEEQRLALVPRHVGPHFKHLLAHGDAQALKTRHHVLHQRLHRLPILGGAVAEVRGHTVLVVLHVGPRDVLHRLHQRVVHQIHRGVESRRRLVGAHRRVLQLAQPLLGALDVKAVRAGVEELAQLDEAHHLLNAAPADDGGGEHGRHLPQRAAHRLAHHRRVRVPHDGGQGAVVVEEHGELLALHLLHDI